MGANVSRDYLEKYHEKRTQANRGAILILGLDNSGKTSLLYQFILGAPALTVPTTTYNMESYSHPKTQKKYDIVDLGGSLLLRELWNAYARYTDGLIMVVDLSDPQTWNDVRGWLRVIEQEQWLVRNSNNTEGANEAGCAESAGNKVRVPIMVAANKCDLVTQQDPQRLETVLEQLKSTLGNDLTKVDCRIVPCSAQTGKNVDKVFFEMFEKA